MAVRFELPYHPSLYLDAVNAGVPVSLAAPGSAPATALEIMALAILAPRPTAEEPEAEATATAAWAAADLHVPVGPPPAGLGDAAGQAAPRGMGPVHAATVAPVEQPSEDEASWGSESVLAASDAAETSVEPSEGEPSWEWQPILLADTAPAGVTRPIDTGAIQPIAKSASPGRAARRGVARLAASVGNARVDVASGATTVPAVIEELRQHSDRWREDRDGTARRRRRRVGVALTSVGVSGLILATALLSMTRSGVSARPGGTPAPSPPASGPLATPTSSGLPASPGASGTTGPSQSLASSAAVSATTLPTFSSTSAGFHLPRQPQPATFVFTNGRGGCGGLATSFQNTGSFLEQGGGGLRLDVGNATDLGSIQPNGVFDVGGAQPPNHWQGQLTTTGGTARYQVANTSGCVETYDVAISFD
jgi:hypothetical protein